MGLFHILLGSLPVFLLTQKQHNWLDNQLNVLMRSIESSQLYDRCCFKRRNCSLGFVHFRLCSIQVVLHFSFNCIGFSILLGDDFFFFFDLSFDDVRLSGLSLDNSHCLSQIDILLSEDWSTLCEGDFKLSNLLICVLELLQTI